MSIQLTTLFIGAEMSLIKENATNQIPKGEPKYKNSQKVGLKANTNFGWVEYFFLSFDTSEWRYYIQPWSGDDKRRHASEDSIILYEDWLNQSPIKSKMEWALKLKE